ncbi:unnamed protein product [Menidia menidia]|uniref:[histone H3]-lysine(4) N-trimethyltransferase n=1 Tax=Menidia menidia TaxID=238744 RepID=A0A8S4AAV0_9TELE|nr:unnamed protein product [Menidia menidia]
MFVSCGNSTNNCAPFCHHLFIPLSLLKVTCNCFTISDGELQEIGVGLYPSLSLLNHDCRPNCVMVFEGTQLKLRAVRDINPEEELTISYIETLSLTEDRQQQLEEQYHFTCHCQRCQTQEDQEEVRHNKPKKQNPTHCFTLIRFLFLPAHSDPKWIIRAFLFVFSSLHSEMHGDTFIAQIHQWDTALLCPYPYFLFVQDRLMLIGEEASWRLLKEALPRLEGIKAESNWQKLFESCCHLLTDTGGEIPDENILKLRITDMALDASIQLGLWKEALIYGVKTLPAYRQYYPDPHPVHGLQLMRVGKLQHHLEHISHALDTFTQAFKILKLTHGEDHPLTDDLRMKMEECQSEMEHHQAAAKMHI